jgi:hypothetical protein
VSGATAGMNRVPRRAQGGAGEDLSAPRGLFIAAESSLCDLAHYAHYRRGAGPSKYFALRHDRAKAGAKGLEAGDMLSRR